MHPPATSPTCVGGGYILELTTNLREDFIIAEKAPTPSGAGAKIISPSRGLLRDSETFAKVRLKLYYRYTVNIGPDNNNHGDMEQSQPRLCSNTIQLSRVFVSSAQNMLYLHVGGGEMFYV